MKRRSAGHWLMVVLILLQLAAEVTMVVLIHRLHVLTELYFGMMVAVCVIGIGLTSAIGLLRIRRNRRGMIAFRRSVATVLAMCITLSCVWISLISWHAMQAVGHITSGAGRVTAQTVNVFVKMEDPAKTLRDAAGYSFGVMQANRADEDMKKALEDVEKQIGTSMKLQEFKNNIELADALQSGKVQAIIMKLSYISLIEDQAGYENFSERVRVLYEYELPIVQPEKQPEKQSESITTTPFVLYLSGSDTRNQYLDVSRSDVNILAAVNPKTKKVVLVNTPRDYYVPISVSNYTQKDKLTHCGIYGIQCSMDTLSHLYGIPVQYYGQINFTGFEKLVDAVGGVDVYSDVAFTSIEGVNFSEGMNRLDGVQALAFARERYALSGGDNDRGKNQMKVLQAVMDKLSARSILINATDILSSMEGMFVTDVSSDNISALIKMQLGDMSKWDIRTVSVTGTGGNDVTYSMPGTTAYVTYPDESSVAAAKMEIERVLGGQ